MSSVYDDKQFLNFIRKQAEFIRTQSLSRKQAESISGMMWRLVGVWADNAEDEFVEHNLMSEVLFEFNLSLQIAYSNYQKERAGMWERIFGFGVAKLKEFDINSLFKK